MSSLDTFVTKTISVDGENISYSFENVKAQALIKDMENVELGNTIVQAGGSKVLYFPSPYGDYYKWDKVVPNFGYYGGSFASLPRVVKNSGYNNLSDPSKNPGRVNDISGEQDFTVKMYGKYYTNTITDRFFIQEAKDVPYDLDLGGIEGGVNSAGSAHAHSFICIWDFKLNRYSASYRNWVDSTTVGPWNPADPNDSSKPARLAVASGGEGVTCAPGHWQYFATTPEGAIKLREKQIELGHNYTVFQDPANGDIFASVAKEYSEEKLISNNTRAVTQMHGFHQTCLSGQTILIIHGGGSGNTGYTPLAEELIKLGANVHIPNFMNLTLSGDTVIPKNPDNFVADSINNLYHYINGTIPTGEASNNFIDLGHPTVSVSNNDTSLNNVILVAHSWGGIPATYLMRAFNGTDRIKTLINLAAVLPDVNGIVPADRQSYNDCNPMPMDQFYNLVLNDAPPGGVPVFAPQAVKVGSGYDIVNLQTEDMCYNFSDTDLSGIFDTSSTDLTVSSFANKLTFMLPEQDYHMGFESGVNLYFKQLEKYNIRYARILRPPGGHMLPVWNPALCAEWIYYGSRGELGPY